MRRQQRKVYRGILNHCYQRTVGGGVIFYSVSDYLVFFTIYCTAARKHDVRVVSLCLMPDHIHQSTIAGTREALSAFVGAYSRLFTRVHNPVCSRRGALFESPFGSAPKQGGKKGRTNLIYIGNNAPERHLCEVAEEYRWNFLAYYGNNHPFSEPISLHSASKGMRKAVQEIRQYLRMFKPLNYAQLQRLFRPLDRQEKQQLTDFIISSYNVIDYEAAIRFFDSYDDMISSMHANTGSEYDLNEVFTGRSDACYSRLTQIILRETGISDIHDIFFWPEEERYDLFKSLFGRTDATPEQLAAYLHIHLTHIVNGEVVSKR